MHSAAVVLSCCLGFSRIIFAVIDVFLFSFRVGIPLF